MYIELNSLSKNSQISLFLLKPDHVSKEYVSWLNDPQVNQYLECRFVTHTIKSVRSFVQGVLDSPNNLLLGITSHTLNRYVGNIKIGPIDKNHGIGDLGIMIGDKSAWGKDIGSLAIDMMGQIARDLLSLRKITAGCYASNVTCQAALKKNGFIIEAVRKEHYRFNGKLEDVVLMGKWLN